MNNFHTPVDVFGSQHLMALVVCFLCGAWYLSAARQADDTDRRKMTWLLSALLFWSYPISVMIKMFLIPGLRWQDALPFHMCSIMTYIAAAALLLECPFLRAITYFMGILVCIQALITPALAYSFPSPIFYDFFASHTLIVVAALYLPLVLGWRPRKNDFGKVFLFGFCYMLVMLAVNPLLDTNYGFVRYAPEGGSILDLFGPWPWYLLGILVPAFVLMWALTLPFRKRNQGMTETAVEH